MIPIVADEKTGVMYRRWEASSAKAVLVLVHGLGAHSERWRFLADFFLRNNISSYAIELEGFGETGGVKGHVDFIDTYFSGVSRLFDIARKEYPGRKIFLAGESVGALISFSVMADAFDVADGLVCISPAFSSKLKINLIDYLKMFMALLYNPKKQFKVPFNAEMCTRDVEYQKLMKEDKREHRLISAKLAFEITWLQRTALAGAAKIKLPALFLLAGNDNMVRSDVSKRVFGAIASKDKKIIEYPGMRHALSIETDREKVFEEMLKWIISYL